MSQDQGGSLEDRLTRRQREILMLLRKGVRPKEIAEHLVLSEATVRSHIRDLCSRLQVHGAYEAVTVAHKRLRDN